MATIDVKDASNATVAIEKPLAPGRATAALSRPVVLSDEDKTTLDAILTALGGLGLAQYVDGLETLIGATNTAIAALNTLLTTQAGYLDGVEGKLDQLHTDAIAATPAGTNTIGKVDHTSTGISHGSKNVTTAGTDVALVGSSTPAKWVIVQARRSNTANIAVGGSGVDATASTGDGVTLAAGESITLAIDNLTDVFIDATVSGEGVRFTYGT